MGARKTGRSSLSQYNPQGHGWQFPSPLISCPSSHTSVTWRTSVRWRAKQSETYSLHSKTYSPPSISHRSQCCLFPVQVLKHLLMDGRQNDQKHSLHHKIYLPPDSSHHFHHCLLGVSGREGSWVGHVSVPSCLSFHANDHWAASSHLTTGNIYGFPQWGLSFLHTPIDEQTCMYSHTFSF